MYLRKSTLADRESIMKIIVQSQAYFKAQGIDQWQNNYPNLEVIQDDIRNESSYVLVKNGEVVATAVLTFARETSYESVYEGQWLSDQPYGVIHRIAVDHDLKGLGLSSMVMKEMEAICLTEDIHSVRVDTHEENLSMKKLLQKNGFIYCGYIYLTSGAKRVVFEKLL